MRRDVRWLALCLAATLATCAAPPPPPPPTVVQPVRVLIRDFTVDATQVALDGSVRSAGGGDEARVSDAHAAQETVAQTLLYRMRQLGWTVSRAEAASPPQPGDLLIDGRIDRVEEGDRAQRAAGGGRALVSGEAHLLVPQTGQPATELSVLQASSQDADVPGMPGAAAAVAAALGSGGQRSRQLLRAGVSAEARRMGNRLADQIAQVLAQKGWTAPGV